jgi:hypothetical protein
MKRNLKTSISLSEDELGILDSISRRLNLSRSEIVRHFILYHGMCGGDMPLTSKILKLAEKARDGVVAEIRRRAEENDPAQPQSFRKWVKETLGKADEKTVENGTMILLDDLLSSHYGSTRKVGNEG